MQHPGDQPARPRHEEPSGLDREPPRPSVRRHCGQETWHLAGKSLGRRRPPVVMSDREAAAEIERVEVGQ